MSLHGGNPLKYVDPLGLRYEVGTNDKGQQVTERPNGKSINESTGDNLGDCDICNAPVSSYQGEKNLERHIKLTGHFGPVKANPSTPVWKVKDEVVNREVNNSSQIECDENNHGKPREFVVSNEYIEFVKQYEEFLPEPTRGIDNNNLTIGYGHVIKKGESFTSITEEEAVELLLSDLEKIMKKVNETIERHNLCFNQNQYDGLVDMVFNKGGKVVDTDRSSMINSIIGNKSDEEILDNFLKWNKVRHKDPDGVERKYFSKGVFLRSYDSAEMFLYGDYSRQEIHQRSDFPNKAYEILELQGDANITWFEDRRLKWE